MARTVFQARPSPIDSCMRQVSIKKSNDRTFQMTNDASLYITLTCHLALRLQLEHTTQQNTQVCIPKENCYIQSKMV
jgi:hypothetical protein